MKSIRFSKWTAWKERVDLKGLDFPGVYAICRSNKDISTRKFEWKKNIIYIGMTNSLSGLRGRLKQFDNGIRGKPGHGGADRVRYKYLHYDKLVDKLYVCVHPVRCDVTSVKPIDLMKMGRVVRLEYVCFAGFAKRFGRLPEFNDKKISPKYRKPK